MLTKDEKAMRKREEDEKQADWNDLGFRVQGVRVQYRGFNNYQCSCGVPYYIYSIIYPKTHF